VVSRMMLRNLLALVLLAPVALGFAPSATMPRGLVQQRRALAPPSSIAMMASTPLSNGAKKISVPEGSRYRGGGHRRARTPPWPSPPPPRAPTRAHTTLRPMVRPLPRPVALRYTLHPAIFPPLLA